MGTPSNKYRTNKNKGQRTNNVLNYVNQPLSLGMSAIEPLPVNKSYQKETVKGPPTSEMLANPY